MKFFIVSEVKLSKLKASSHSAGMISNDITAIPTGAVSRLHAEMERAFEDCQRVEFGNEAEGYQSVLDTEEKDAFVFSTEGVNEILTIKANGEFYVMGKRVTENIEVYRAFHSFLLASGHLKVNT